MIDNGDSLDVDVATRVRLCNMNILSIVANQRLLYGSCVYQYPISFKISERQNNLILPFPYIIYVMLSLYLTKANQNGVAAAKLSEHHPILSRI